MSNPEPIDPTTPRSVALERLARLLGTSERDLEAVEKAHRALIEADPVLHRKLLAYLAAREPSSPHLGVGLAVLAVSADTDARAFVSRLVEQLPVPTVAALVDYVHGWIVDRKHVKLARKRFQDSMSKAYEASGGAVREKLEREARRSGGKLEEFRGGEILVTLGQYDRVQQVLDHLQIPYRTLPCRVVPSLPLRADQVVIVNCPGQFEAPGIEALRRFVIGGGTLITTDWALKTTLVPAFPEVLKWEGKQTADDVVAVSSIHPTSVYTQGVEVPGQTLRWWLEGASYPITILDPRVEVLVRSSEMKTKYGEEPLVVVFAYGEGMVFHLTSHYYLQRSEGEKGAKAQDVAASLGIAGKAGLEGLTAGQVSAAYSSLRLLANILFERQRVTGV